MTSSINQPEIDDSRSLAKAVHFRGQFGVILDDKPSAKVVKPAVNNKVTSDRVTKIETTEEPILRYLQQIDRKVDMMAKQIKGLEKALEGQAEINKKLQKNFDEVEREELKQKAQEKLKAPLQPFPNVPQWPKTREEIYQMDKKTMLSTLERVTSVNGRRCGTGWSDAPKERLLAAVERFEEEHARRIRAEKEPRRVRYACC